MLNLKKTLLSSLAILPFIATQANSLISFQSNKMLCSLMINSEHSGILLCGSEQLGSAAAKVYIGSDNFVIENNNSLVTTTKGYQCEFQGFFHINGLPCNHQKNQCNIIVSVNCHNNTGNLDLLLSG